VAQAFATLGGLYPRRIFLGLGTGESVNEVPSGGGWGPYSERARRLEESIEIIRRLWSEEWVTYDGGYHRVTGANIYDKPSHPVPIYVAAGGPRSAAIAGSLGDGWITDVASLLLPTRQPVRDALAEAVKASGRKESDLRVLVESYVVLGDESEAEYAANLWRFLPIVTDMLQVTDPRVIQQRAEAEVPINRALRRFFVSPDPAAHAGRIRELFDAGATDVFIHAPQRDQERILEAFATNILPNVRSLRT
jgi:alkanesulfonate monooxygenase SsuD/methylene tetrahydromethanopterin reductase-like flavin-dependent oxidoreductase (luciferase family)